MGKFQFRREGASQVAELLTTEQFVSRYFGSSDELRTTINDLTEFAPNLLENLETCIEYSRLGYKINSVIRKKIHQKTEMPYLYFSIDKRNGSVPLMLLNEGNVASFLDDYQSGKVKIEFTFKELAEFINN